MMLFSGFRKSSFGRPWNSGHRNHAIAALIVILGLYLVPIIYLIAQGQSLSSEAYLFYLSIYCPLNIVIIFIILRYLCRESFWDLNLGAGRVSMELAATFLLSLLILVCNVFLQRLLAMFLPDPPGTGVRNLFIEMSEGPGSLLGFIGPLLFMGAVAEELTRVFLISRLWKLMPSKRGKLLAVVISAVLFGLVHVSRGPTHVVWAGIFGLIMGLYYLKFGRVVPLILAHYLTNAIQVMLVIVLFGSS
jgi:membrane protease YdiL (CAAX protease family)